MYHIVVIFEDRDPIDITTQDHTTFLDILYECILQREIDGLETSFSRRLITPGRFSMYDKKGSLFAVLWISYDFYNKG
jgi:hypothetical protein